MPPIEWFEAIALLRAFAVEAIKDGRDKHEDIGVHERMSSRPRHYDARHRNYGMDARPR